MKKTYLTDLEQRSLVTSLQEIFSRFPRLHRQNKWKLTCYYIQKWTYRKLLFYINPRKQGVVLGISHYATDILEKFPFLQSMVDEMKTSVMKLVIKTPEDIDRKAIVQLISMILEK